MPEKSNTVASSRIERMLWWRQLRSAVSLNAHDLDLWECAHPLSGVVVDAVDAARAAALHVRSVLPYRFTGVERILELRQALRRGYGACGDATAAVAAAVLMSGGECDVCYELARCADGSEPIPGYAHVRVVVGGSAVDAYPDESLEVDGCAGRVGVSRESVRWPMTDAVALSLLDARRRQAGRLS